MNHKFTEMRYGRMEYPENLLFFNQFEGVIRSSGRGCGGPPHNRSTSITSLSVSITILLKTVLPGVSTSGYCALSTIIVKDCVLPGESGGTIGSSELARLEKKNIACL